MYKQGFSRFALFALIVVVVGIVASFGMALPLVAAVCVLIFISSLISSLINEPPLKQIGIAAGISVALGVALAFLASTEYAPTTAMLLGAASGGLYFAVALIELILELAFKVNSGSGIDAETIANQAAAQTLQEIEAAITAYGKAAGVPDLAIWIVKFNSAQTTVVTVPRLRPEFQPGIKVGPGQQVVEAPKTPVAPVVTRSQPAPTAAQTPVSTSAKPIGIPGGSAVVGQVPTPPPADAKPASTGKKTPEENHMFSFLNSVGGSHLVKIYLNYWVRKPFSELNADFVKIFTEERLFNRYKRTEEDPKFYDFLEMIPGALTGFVTYFDRTSKGETYTPHTGLVAACKKSADFGVAEAIAPKKAAVELATLGVE